MKLHENIAALRKREQWSQEMLGEKLNVSRQAISKWESGQGLPELEKLITMSELFGVSLDELLGTATRTTEQAAQQIRDLDALAEHLRQTKSKTPPWIPVALGILGVAVLALFFLLYNMDRRLDSIAMQPPVIHTTSVPVQESLFEDQSLTYGIIDGQTLEVAAHVKVRLKRMNEGTKVNFLLNDTAHPMQAEGGSFTLDLPVPYATDNTYYLQVVDGSDIQNERMAVTDTLPIQRLDGWLYGLPQSFYLDTHSGTSQLTLRLQYDPNFFASSPDTWWVDRLEIRDGDQVVATQPMPEPLLRDALTYKTKKDQQLTVHVIAEKDGLTYDVLLQRLRIESFQPVFDDAGPVLRILNKDGRVIYEKEDPFIQTFPN